MTPTFVEFHETGVSAGDYVFGTLADLREFVASESEFWSSWSEKILAGIENLPAVVSAIDQHSNHWRYLRDELDKAAARSNDLEVANAVQVLRERLVDQRWLIVSKSKFGALLNNLSASDPNFAATVAYLGLPNAGRNFFAEHTHEGLRQFWNRFAASLPGLLGSNAAPGYLELAQSAAMEADRTRIKLDEYAADLREHVSLTKSEASNQILVSREQLEEVKTGFITEKDTLLSEAKAEWGKLVRAYDLRLKTAAPYNYWRAKEILHRRAADKWLKHMIYGLFSGAAVITVCVWSALDLKSEGAWPWIGQAALAGGPVFVYLWLVRMFNRLFSEQLIRAEDARERATMVKTLLAITRSTDTESLVNAAQAEVITRALFRPGSGLGADDSPSPSMLENAVNAIKSK